MGPRSMSARGSSRARALFAHSLVAFAALPLAGGCAEPRPATSAATAPDLPERARPPERYDPAPVIEVRKVYLDGKHEGYLKVKLDERYERPVKLDLVYDLGFVQRGFRTESGTTYRLEQSGAFTDLGTRQLDDAMRLLLGTANPRTEVAYQPMDRPRTPADEVAPPRRR